MRRWIKAKHKLSTQMQHIKDQITKIKDGRQLKFSIVLPYYNCALPSFKGQFMHDIFVPSFFFPSQIYFVYRKPFQSSSTSLAKRKSASAQLHIQDLRSIGLNSKFSARKEKVQSIEVLFARVAKFACSDPQSEFYLGLSGIVWSCATQLFGAHPGTVGARGLAFSASAFESLVSV